MSEKFLNSRIVHKHDVEAKWLQVPDFIPKQGEIIVYDIDSTYTYERVKIGDGKTKIGSLPFVDDAVRNTLSSDIGEVETKVDDLTKLIGDTSVSEQISTAIADKGLHTVIATSSDGIAYSAIVPGINDLAIGKSFIMVPGVVSASISPTLNVNNLGSKNIRRRLSNLSTAAQNGYTETWLAVNKPLTVMYDGTDWIAEGFERPVAADLYGTLSMKKGGTGAINRWNAFNNIVFLGLNPITSVENDTSLQWEGLGGGYAFFDGFYLNGQPAQWGMLINFTYGSEIFQIWNSQPNGPSYMRSGNSAGLNEWKQIYDSTQSVDVADGLKSTMLLPTSGSVNKDKYVLLKTCEISVGAQGFNGTYLLYDVQTQLYSGIFHAKVRASSTITNVTADVTWLGLNQTVLKECICLTQENASDNSSTKIRLYVKMPSNYSTIKIVSINEELISNNGGTLTTPDSFTFEDSMTGTLLATSHTTSHLDVNSAKKLTTARTITLSGDVNGSVSFDGSKNVTINTEINSVNYTTTLLASGWSSSDPYTQTVTVDGLQSDDAPVVDINLSNAAIDDYITINDNWLLVTRMVAGNNSITAYCSDVPSIDIPINIKVI